MHIKWDSYLVYEGRVSSKYLNLRQSTLVTQLKSYSIVKSFKIGMTSDVKFNTSQDKLAAGTYSGNVSLIDLRFC